MVGAYGGGGGDAQGGAVDRSGALRIDEGGGGGGEETTPRRYDITCMPADYTLGTLYDMWKSGAIVIPEFQRGYVWKPRQASRLIESFAMDLPVPPVFMMMRNGGQDATVVDGMQRLLTVFYFFDGHYGPRGPAGDRKVFRIVGISRDNDLYGKRFEDLAAPIQRRLKSQILRAMQVRPTRPGPVDAAMYQIAERLNTGGTMLSEQEIRNCMYAGKLNGLLRDVNVGKDWRKIVGTAIPHPRMKDVQLALRCMALLHKGAEYKPPMKDFLSAFMAAMRNPPDGIVAREREAFADTCRGIVDHLGERPFHNQRGALRAPLLDAVFVAFAQSGGARPPDLPGRLRRLIDDGRFVSFSGASSADTASVKGRLAVARSVLFG